MFPNGCTPGDLDLDVQDFNADNVCSTFSEYTKRALRALVADRPYDLYWYDKKPGTYISTGGSYSLRNNVFYFGDNFSISVKFAVSKDYADPRGTIGGYVFDTSIPAKVSTAAKNARKIVANNAGKSDYYKLCAYKASICGLVDYNDDAAAATNPA